MSIVKSHSFWFIICGFNIAIVAGLFTLLFTRLLGRVKGVILALVGIVLYTLLGGAMLLGIRIEGQNIKHYMQSRITSSRVPTTSTGKS